MRNLVLAAVVAAIGLVAVGVLGVATAESPTVTTPPRTVSVQGIATQPIAQSSSAAAATAVYRQGMAEAINDGQAKAQFLAGKAGATLGPVQSIVEDGGFIGCAGNEEYVGEQPDFGSPSVPFSVAGASTRSAAGRPVPAVGNAGAPHRPAKHRHKRPAAKHAVAAGCTLSAQVSLVYVIG
jgi:Protein of unknown function (DUF541)